MVLHCRYNVLRKRGFHFLSEKLSVSKLGEGLLSLQSVIFFENIPSPDSKIVIFCDRTVVFPYSFSAYTMQISMLRIIAMFLLQSSYGIWKTQNKS